jgi:hypothetical protein
VGRGALLDVGIRDGDLHGVAEAHADEGAHSGAVVRERLGLGGGLRAGRGVGRARGAAACRMGSRRARAPRGRGAAPTAAAGAPPRRAAARTWVLELGNLAAVSLKARTGPAAGRSSGQAAAAAAAGAPSAASSAVATAAASTAARGAGARLARGFMASRRSREGAGAGGRGRCGAGLAALDGVLAAVTQVWPVAHGQ